MIELKERCLRSWQMTAKLRNSKWVILGTILWKGKDCFIAYQVDKPILLIVNSLELSFYLKDKLLCKNSQPVRIVSITCKVYAQTHKFGKPITKVGKFRKSITELNKFRKSITELDKFRKPITKLDKFRKPITKLSKLISKIKGR